MRPMSRRPFLQSGAAAGLAVAVADLFPDLMSTASPAANGSPPSPDSMAGDWLPVSALAHDREVGTFWAGLEADTNITGFQRLTMPPYSREVRVPT